jgi:hypothetical protein
VIALVGEYSQDGVKDLIKALAHVFRKESQDQVPIFLQDGVLSPITPVGLGIGEVLSPVDFHHKTTLPAQ